MGKRILLCGHRAFAAQGLRQQLEAAGHDVMQFSRGKEAQEGKIVTGEVAKIDSNPHLDADFDCIINFIVLKFRSIEENTDYTKALINRCVKSKVQHLIHISSMSVYPDFTKEISENSEIKKTPYKCGLYAGAKVATDIYLMRSLPKNIKLSLLRPAYIIASGVRNPVGSAALKLSGGYSVLLSRANRKKGLIDRDIIHKGITFLIEHPPINPQEILLFIDPKSPTHKEYLKFCNKELKFSKRTFSLPFPLWLPFFFTIELKKSRLKQFKIKRFFKSLYSRLLLQKYNTNQTEKRLNLSLSTDWKKVLSENR